MIRPIAIFAAILGMTGTIAFTNVLFVGCASTPSPKVVSCSEQYAACVPSSADVTAYRACRDKVDAACLSTDAGKP